MSSPGSEELLIIPVPGNCNRYYIVTGIEHDQASSTAGAQAYTFDASNTSNQPIPINLNIPAATKYNAVQLACSPLRSRTQLWSWPTSPRHRGSRSHSFTASSPSKPPRLKSIARLTKQDSHSRKVEAKVPLYPLADPGSIPGLPASTPSNGDRRRPTLSSAKTEG